MIEFDLINPSDPYTFLADDLETAALVVFSLSTMYGAESKDGDINVPVFILGGAIDWYKEQFNRTPDEAIECKREEVAAALASMMYGSFEDRRRYTVALELITDEEKRTEFIEEWQDAHSNLNDIGTYAHNLAKKMIVNS